MDELNSLFDVFEEENETVTDLSLALAASKKIKKRKKGNTEVNESIKTKKPNIAPSSSDIVIPSWKTEISLYKKTIKTKNPCKVVTVERLDKCLHEVVVPENVEYIPLERNVKNEPAKTYPFILDQFQKEAILCLENDRSVLISAHTSAGKTVAAEYSIAMALKNNQRVIYTTPIKALSNQKYREFSNEFKDVGLMTGDVAINHDASCLIMTTEILRNMLYRGSQVTKEVKWIVFDEIHYMRDKDRGVVWEETIIMSSHNARFVFLSATIPNARQFAEWIACIHQQQCHVVYTEHRPVPLQHYLFPAGGAGMYLIVDEHSNFREENFNDAMSRLNDSHQVKEENRLPWKEKAKAVGDNCFKIIKMLTHHNKVPIIAFSFSKRECEMYALQLAKLDFTTSNDKKLITEIWNNALDIVPEEDRHIPQIENLKPILLKGIGIHHGGMLPVLKETVEILFAENLLKVLFATETFSMGLNMPARTVLFTNCRKFDGKVNRFITSGEYIQMSGRAGRRGLDDKGMVLMMVDEKVSPEAAKQMLMGQADPLNSAFHLSYNMILNLMLFGDVNTDFMLKQSFYQFQSYSKLPDYCKELKELENKYDEIKIENEADVALQYTITKQLQLINEKIQNFVKDSSKLIEFLQPGRLIKVKRRRFEHDWGFVINFSQSRGNQAESSHMLIEVMVPTPKSEQSRYCMETVAVFRSDIVMLSALRLVVPANLKSKDNLKLMLGKIEEIKKRFKDKIPTIDPLNDIQIKSNELKELTKNAKILETRLNDIEHIPNIESACNTYEQKMKIAEEIENLISEIKKIRQSDHLQELKKRKRVLQKLDYCTDSDIVKTKGKLVCELNSEEELLLTELIFNGVFTNLKPAECVALLSCTMCDEKSNSKVRMTEVLAQPLKQMQELARIIVKVSKDCHLEIDEDKYIDHFKPYLMDVFYAWCSGSSFLDITKKTDIFEGSIIRVLRRLEEMLKQLILASRSIGNDELENKFSQASTLIKRGIPFAASLYL